MKTTLNLPDDLMRAVKMRAVQENQTMQATIAELLRRGLAQPALPTAVRKRVRLPLVHSTHRAGEGQEMNPERVAEILLEDEVRWHRESL